MEQSTESIIQDLRMRVGELEAELDRVYAELENWENIAKEFGYVNDNKW